MRKDKINILATSQVDPSWTGKAYAFGISLDIIPFIKTESILSIEVQQEIELAATEYATVVFTSSAAVEAVTELLEGAIPEWDIYCIGYHTKEKVIGHFGKERLAGAAGNASALADKIIEQGEAEEVIFFAGNTRRNELPDRLRQEGIEVNEITVYQTTLTPQETAKPYDAVLFFSPSTVESFYIKNKLAASATAFAIGSTTADHIKKYFPNQVVVSDHPSRDEVVELAIAHFTADQP